MLKTTLCVFTFILTSIIAQANGPMITNNTTTALCVMHHFKKSAEACPQSQALWLTKGQSRTLPLIAGHLGVIQSFKAEILSMGSAAVKKSSSEPFHSIDLHKRSDIKSICMDVDKVSIDGIIVKDETVVISK